MTLDPTVTRKTSEMIANRTLNTKAAKDKLHEILPHRPYWDARVQHLTPEQDVEWLVWLQSKEAGSRA